VSQVVTIFTVGHSNLEFEAFVALLRHHGARVVADVRRFPSSRAFPHFNQGVLRKSLDDRGIRYYWFEDLGGRRNTAPAEVSLNGAIEDPAFRSYADHMASEPFNDAASRLIALASQIPTAIMCAERSFERCHRRFLSDFLVAQGAAVNHIVALDDLRPHHLHSAAVVDGAGRITYPGTGRLF